MHEDLLKQAARLATLDVKKPKQANLRRAISSAYYAVFHLLVDEACRVQIGAQHNQRHSVRYWESLRPRRHEGSL